MAGGCRKTLGAMDSVEGTDESRIKGLFGVFKTMGSSDSTVCGFLLLLGLVGTLIVDGTPQPP